MKTLFVLFILQLASVRGDSRLEREIDEPHPVPERGEVNAREENGALGAMIAPRADPVAVPSQYCGYLGGDPNPPWVCVIPDRYCVVEPSEGVIGCCSSNFCGAFRTACYEQTDPCDSACSSNHQNLFCSGAEPICATYTYPSSVTEVRCESTIPSILSVAYTTSGFSTPIRLPRVVAGFSITSQGANFSYLSLVTGTQYPPSSTAAPSSTPTSTFATSTSASSPSTASTTSTSTPATTSNPASTSPATSTSNPEPVGAIVGGVIGGLAIITAFAALVLWLRYKTNQRPAVDLYPQMPNNPASVFQLSPTAATLANDRKDEQTRSIVNEAYAPPGTENELP